MWSVFVFVVVVVVVAVVAVVVVVVDGVWNEILCIFVDVSR